MTSPYLALVIAYTLPNGTVCIDRLTFTSPQALARTLWDFGMQLPDLDIIDLRERP